ncbi:YhcN/YlaJ family sporulation lipoprotein [Virgibacillus sp. W0430]|uniref:YhcN/YlaJ family sporulation lipoprotein n=1 Tax=Virgibacillus sp. W0430 TaxID=3391580 RepID=UPI003F46BCBA
MKLKLASIILAVFATLIACQANTDDKSMEEGRMDNDNTFERTGYKDEMDREKRMGDMNRNLNGDNNGANNTYDVAEKAAEKITSQIAEIDQAYVLTTENNAYVAAVLDNANHRDNNNTNNANENGLMDRGKGEELTDDVKNEIKSIVQSVDNSIDNVYVTTNPDFADLTNNYITDMDEGRPVEGIFDQIGNAIERVFPQNE